MSETKKWLVEYSHDDGRSGTVEVITKVGASDSFFKYGNGKSGVLNVCGSSQLYDLRYCTESDLHMAMLETYFGKSLVWATKI